MVKYLGTHNSGTASELVWFLRPFSWILNCTSKCQTLTIKEQLAAGVKLFNLQVTFYKNQWVFSHGLCIYKDRLFDAVDIMNKYSTKSCPIYYQLYLDKNLLLGQNVKQFRRLIDALLERNKNVIMLCAWVEGGDYIYKSGINIDINEKYWTKSWSQSKGLLNKIPLPKKYAMKYNKMHIDDNKSDYLMLDFIEYD